MHCVKWDRRKGMENEAYGCVWVSLPLPSSSSQQAEEKRREKIVRQFTIKCTSPSSSHEPNLLYYCMHACVLKSHSNRTKKKTHNTHLLFTLYLFAWTALFFGVETLDILYIYIGCICMRAVEVGTLLQDILFVRYRFSNSPLSRVHLKLYAEKKM